jgi:hypothetical protein
MEPKALTRADAQRGFEAFKQALAQIATAPKAVIQKAGKRAKAQRPAKTG